MSHEPGYNSPPLIVLTTGNILMYKQEPCQVYLVFLWLHQDFMFCWLDQVDFLFDQPGGNSLVDRWKQIVYLVETIEFHGVNSLVSFEHQLVIRWKLFSYPRK